MSKYSVPYGKGFPSILNSLLLWGADVIMPIDVPGRSDPIGEVEHFRPHPVDLAGTLKIPSCKIWWQLP